MSFLANTSIEITPQLLTFNRRMENKNNRLNNLPFLKSRRRKLRNKCTMAEDILWQHIKHSKLGGRKFRRQHSIGRYILDFYCPSERLAIELDGPIHDRPERIAYDRKRTEYLISVGIRVVRFRNKALLQNPKKVLTEIAEHFEESDQQE